MGREASAGSAPVASSVLAIGFGATVAMWGAGYFSRLPAVMLPSPLLLGLLLACPLGGGLLLGRHAGLGFRHGALAGALSGVLNLLVLAGALGDAGRGTPSAGLWVPGSILLAAALAGMGAAAGRRWLRSEPAWRDWPAAFAWVASVAALLLLAVGGLVTSTGSGLAVVDWPNSFGYNMFLYPLSRMTGGVYYEHAHRLFGALVGLTTLTLALVLQRTDDRRWVRRLAWSVAGLVLVQGILGGLRVTGRFTWSTSAGDMSPSLALAVIHGVLGQLVFAILVALGTFTTPAWKRARGAEAGRAGAHSEQAGTAALVVLLVVQLVLGAVQRHLSALLLVHMAVGIAVVGPLALHVGFRAWGANGNRRPLPALGLALVAAVAGQILLGLAAFAAGGATDPAGGGTRAPGVEIAITTAHQWFGAVLLALAVKLACWTFRLLRPARLGAGAERHHPVAAFSGSGRGLSS